MFSLYSDHGLQQIRWCGEEVLSYHCDVDSVRPYWHPLRLPGGPVLTMNEPADHIHHQGMWIAWKLVNGVNFWEQPRPDADPTGFGRIVHQGLVTSNVTEEHVDFVAENLWVDWQGTAHMRETRQTSFGAPQDDHWAIDVRMQFHADERDVTLDLKRGEPGRGGLFYSGLTIRFDNAMTPGAMLDAEGRTETADIFGSRAAWCGYSGTHTADGQVYGITILDHPENPRYPTPWWVRNGTNYAILLASPCYHEPITIAKGESLAFRYRVGIHRGTVGQEVAEALAWDSV